MLPGFLNTVGGAILFCATSPYTTIRADAARLFIYGWRRDPLMCYPPYTPVGRPFTVIPPYTNLG